MVSFAQSKSKVFKQRTQLSSWLYLSRCFRFNLRFTTAQITNTTLTLDLIILRLIFSDIILKKPSWPGLLCRGVRPPNERPGYDTKQSDREVPVMLKLCGMQSTPSLPSFPGSLWLGVVAPDRVISMGQIELNGVLMLNWIV